MYVGSAKANLAKRIERHKRKRKKMHWHLDYFRGHCEMIAGLPIRTSGRPQAMTLCAQERRKGKFSDDDLAVHKSVDVDLTKIDVECTLADAVRAVAEWDVPKFGSSDCDCKSHLFGMSENPIHNKNFMDTIEKFRMNHLDTMIEIR